MCAYTHTPTHTQTRTAKNCKDSKMIWEGLEKEGEGEDIQLIIVSRKMKDNLKKNS